MSIKRYSIKVNGTVYDVEVEELGEVSAAPTAPAAPAPVAAPPPAPTPKKEETKGEGQPVTAPINGTILSVAVKVGDSVKKGDLLCILEAMKMENEVFSPNDGTITAVNVETNSSVGAGDSLFYIK